MRFRKRRVHTHTHTHTHTLTHSHTHTDTHTHSHIHTHTHTDTHTHTHTRTHARAGLEALTHTHTHTQCHTHTHTHIHTPKKKTIPFSQVTQFRKGGRQQVERTKMRFRKRRHGGSVVAPRASPVLQGNSRDPALIHRIRCLLLLLSGLRAPGH